jgi:uncharacterized protein YsxB (DUF464 family)
MISVTIRRNPAGDIYGFSVLDHGGSIVCAAVSLLTLNTVNSIEFLLDEDLIYDHNPEKGGLLHMELPRIKEGHRNREADLLLESMALGLRSVRDSYGNEIEINEIKVDESG